MHALLLSRLQFAFTIAFHILFPSFTIGLASAPVWRKLPCFAGIAVASRR